MIQLVQICEARDDPRGARFVLFAVDYLSALARPEYAAGTAIYGEP